jgi:polysaccharide biosynthesis transport protein
MNKLVTISTRHWKYLLGFNLLVAFGTIAAVVTAKPVWTTTTQLILPKTTSNLDANLGTLGSLKNGDPGFSAEVNPLKVQASILTSETLLEQVLNIDPEKEKFSGVSKYKGLFKITPQEQSTIISLTVSASNQELATKRAQNLIDAYQQRLNELRQANRQARQQFSKDELEQVKIKLELAQAKIARFKKTSGLVDNDEQTRGIVSTVNTLTAARAQALAAAASSENRAKVLSSRLNLEPKQAVQSLSLGENKEYQYLRTKLAEVDAMLAQKKAILTNEHPEVITLQSQQPSCCWR